ncbi:MAG: glycoside hydrolase family 5 protein [Muribaculaceae bacterium]
MKTSILIASLLAIASALSINCYATSSVSAVERHGELKVDGKYIVDCHGDKVQLRGVSFGWHNWWHRYFNEGSVDKVANEWGATIVRCSIGLNLDDQCYDKNRHLAYATVDSMVNAAVKHGVYVLVDFHSHKNNLALAKEFFEAVTKKYGNVPNVLYEIWNEPEEIPWQEIKDYANEIIPLIRRNAPKSIIIVPTPKWDQLVDLAADAPLTGYSNIVYSVHYYSATHKDWNREKVIYAINKGLPVFFAETGGMLHTGDGVFDMDSWEEWLKIARENSISWIAWSISDKVESCSMLVPGAPANGREWKESHLKPWAVLVRHYLQSESENQ